jgi:hypothetical protein
MTQQTIDLGIILSDETIRLGPLMLRFLITGETSTGSVAAFELDSPDTQRLTASALSHDPYDQTTYGSNGVPTGTVNTKPIDVGPGQELCIPCGAVPGFDNNRSHDAEALRVITLAAKVPQYFGESADGINESAGGELARW